MPKILNLTSFWKPTACGQTVLPNGSVLKGQKLVKMPKYGRLWGDFESKFIQLTEIYRL